MFHHVSASLNTTIRFLRDHNGDAATLLFCVTPAIVPYYIEYIKIRVEKFYLYLLIMQIYANAMLWKFLS